MRNPIKTAMIFDRRNPPIRTDYGQPIDAVIVAHANRATDIPWWLPNRPVLYAINGRIC